MMADIENQESYAEYLSRTPAEIPETVISNLRKSPLSEKDALLPKNVGYAMAMHCTQEYNNLAEILPELYHTYA